MRLFLFTGAFLLSVVMRAEQLVEFSFTKPHSLLNFVETIMDKQGTSQTLRDIYKQSRFNTNSSRLQIEKLSKLKTDYTFHFDGYPSSRFMYRSSWDILIINAARCETLHELKISTVGLFPNADQTRLFEGLMYFDTIYSDLIWNDNLNKLAGYCTQLNDYAKTRNIDLLFQKLSRFYGSSWDPDVPFRVCLYPIPAKRGNSTATPKGNIVTCGVLLDSYDYANTLGVVFHELCHLLYREQSPELQNKVEHWFVKSTSPYRMLAYQLTDEGLATSLGNGWIYESISGKTDTADWYNDFYINRFAKQSYPLIKEYVSNGGTFDPGLVNSLIEIYSKSFPDAQYDLNNLFSNIHMVSDMNDTDAGRIFPAVFRNFRVGGAGLSTPLDENNLADFDTHLATRIVLISADNKRSWELVKKNIEGLKLLKLPDTTRNFFMVSQAGDGNSYILINLLKPQDVDLALDMMKKQGKMDQGNSLVYF